MQRVANSALIATCGIAGGIFSDVHGLRPDQAYAGSAVGIVVGSQLTRIIAVNPIAVAFGMGFAPIMFIYNVLKK